MKLAVAILLTALACTKAQDTYSCPDGWEKHAPEGEDECKCFLFADNYAKATHDDATLLCEGHDGWLAELEDGPGDNYWVVGKLKERHSKKRQMEGKDDNDNGILTGPHFEDQWWIGAKSYTKHDEHRPGEWIWEHLNTTVEWFDWAPDEPNDYHRQQCLAFLRYVYDEKNWTYQWNDWECRDVADYICEKNCAV